MEISSCTKAGMFTKVSSGPQITGVYKATTRPTRSGGPWKRHVALMQEAKDNRMTSVGSTTKHSDTTSSVCYNSESLLTAVSL